MNLFAVRYRPMDPDRAATPDGLITLCFRRTRGLHSTDFLLPFDTIKEAEAASMALIWGGVASEAQVVKTDGHNTIGLVRTIRRLDNA